MRKAGRLFAPAIVLTGHQIAGAARRELVVVKAGRDHGHLCVPSRRPFRPHQVPLLAGLAVRNAIVEVTSLHGIQLKWPNDLLYDGRKLAGLLCERVEKVDLIGLGLNVNVRAKDCAGVAP